MVAHCGPLKVTRVEDMHLRVPRIYDVVMYTSGALAPVASIPWRIQVMCIIWDKCVLYIVYEY